MKEHLRDKKWYPGTVTACVAVTLYVVLTHLAPVLGAVRTFLGYFGPLFLGSVLAYLMNPLAMLYRRTLFKKPGRETLHWTASIALAVLTLLLFLTFLLGTLIPQLAESVTMLVNNMEGYLASLHALTERLGVAETLNLDQLVGTSGDLMNRVLSFLKDNVEGIVNASAAAGKGVVRWLIALILSVYLLASKASVKGFALRLLRALLSKRACERTVTFFARCDRILVRYITFSLLDALIVGAANAVFMMCLGMQYTGLVPLVAGVTNLIPTFGPIIGGAIGAFILLLVNPVHALIFIVFTLGLQFLDGYIIKPKLFGNSLGVSGLLILIAVIVCGNMFGIVGILFAIPLAAILDFICEEALLPALEKRPKS